MNLSAVILTWNEEKYIRRCLASLQGICDDIVVVDSYSSDKTREMATAMGARVVQLAYHNTRDSRNYGLELCMNDWRLVIDADEYLDPDSKESFNLWAAILEKDGWDAAEFPRWNRVDGIEVRPQPEPVVHLVKRGVMHGGHPLHAHRAANAKRIYRMHEPGQCSTYMRGIIHDKTGLEWMQAARMYWYMCPYTFTQEVPGIPGMVMVPPGSEDLQVPGAHWERRDTINVWDEYIQTPAYRKLGPADIGDLIIDKDGWHRRPS